MMKIVVPEYNDSFSKVVLCKKEYLIRFTYNDSYDYWTFGIYDLEKKPMITGIKIVPNFPMNLYYKNKRMPQGVFEAHTTLSRIGHNDFKNGNASFYFEEAVW